MLNRDTDKLDGLRTYLDGKVKRYNLLFAVNGGAFAIAKLLPGSADTISGELDLTKLAIGTILFTEVMAVDIWLWGQGMRTDFFRNKIVFTPIGKVILILLALLLIAAWALAAELAWYWIAALIVIFAVGLSFAHRLATRVQPKNRTASARA